MQSGCGEVTVTPEFSGQYLWAEGIANSSEPKGEGESDNLSSANMNNYIDEMMSRIIGLSYLRELVIWGMATKGVMFALHALNQGLHVSYGVDINKDKQGKFAPVSGLRIDAPEDLPVNKSYTVICTNPNYMEEITEHLKRMGLDYMLVIL